MRTKDRLFLILAIIFVLYGCQSGYDNGIDSNGKRTKIRRNSNEIIDNFKLAKREDLFAELTSHNYINSNDILDIVGNKIADKASEKETSFNIIAKKDTREIQQVNINCFNAIFDIEKAKNDSVTYQVEVKKPILKGGSVYQVLTDLGMHGKDVGYYAWRLGEYIDATSIDIGDTLFVNYYVDTLNTKRFEKFSYKADRTSLHEFYIEGPKELRYEKISYPFILKEHFITGEVTKDYPSLDRAMFALGVTPYVRQQVNDAMESQLSMRSDARVGDKFEIIVQEKWVTGIKEPHGKVMYAEYSGRRTGTKSAYRFVDKDEDSAFNGMYAENGKGLVQGNYRTPLNNMHITSPYGYRIHPILGRRIKHKGMDLRGSRGTYVYAVSSGKITKAANSGNGYGKEVQVRHDNGMVTQYAHLSRINVRRGRRVKKGQIIGKVGSTGRSTGPHLHFGVQVSGRWVNPRTNLKMVAATKLKGARKTKYLEQVKKLKTLLVTKKQEYIARTNPSADTLNSTTN